MNASLLARLERTDGRFDELAAELASAVARLGSQLRSTETELSGLRSDVATGEQQRGELETRLGASAARLDGLEEDLSARIKSLEEALQASSALAQDGIAGLVNSIEGFSAEVKTVHALEEQRVQADERFTRLEQRFEELEQRLSGSLEEQAAGSDRAVAELVSISEQANQKLIEMLEARASSLEVSIGEQAEALNRFGEERQGAVREGAEAVSGLRAELEAQLEGAQLESRKQREQSIEREAELERRLGEVEQANDRIGETVASAGEDSSRELRVELERLGAAIAELQRGAEETDANADPLDERLTQALEQLERTISRHEARLVDLERSLADHQYSARPAAAGAPPAVGEADDGPLSIDTVSFERLREMGLSVTQSARIVAYRDTKGGIRSVDDLGRVPGLSGDQRDHLASTFGLEGAAAQ